MLSELSTNYFNAFSRPDILRLEKYLSDDVSMHYWNLDASGIELVLNDYADILKSLSEVVVDVVNLHESQSTVVAELIIMAKEIGSIKVVDILSFTKMERYAQ